MQSDFTKSFMLSTAWGDRNLIWFQSFDSNGKKLKGNEQKAKLY